jgi:hypothetical protein
LSPTGSARARRRPTSAPSASATRSTFPDDDRVCPRLVDTREHDFSTPSVDTRRLATTRRHPSSPRLTRRSGLVSGRWSCRPRPGCLHCPTTSPRHTGWRPPASVWSATR